MPILRLNQSVADPTGLPTIPRGLIIPDELRPSGAEAFWMFERDARSYKDLTGNDHVLSPVGSFVFQDNHIITPGNLPAAPGDMETDIDGSVHTDLTIAMLYYSQTTSGFYALDNVPDAITANNLRYGHIVSGAKPAIIYRNPSAVQQSIGGSFTSITDLPRWAAFFHGFGEANNINYSPQNSATTPATGTVTEDLTLRGNLTLFGAVNDSYQPMPVAEAIVWTRILSLAEMQAEYAKMKLRAAWRGITLTE